MDSEDVILAFHKPPGTSARGVRQNSTPDKESSTAKPSCSYLNAYTGTIQPRRSRVKRVTRAALNGAKHRQGVSISGFMGAQWQKKL